MKMEDKIWSQIYTGLGYNTSPIYIFGIIIIDIFGFISDDSRLLRRRSKCKESEDRSSPKKEPVQNSTHEKNGSVLIDYSKYIFFAV